MREKQLKLIITFYTTTASMSMEKLCNKKKLLGRLIPVPKSITACCGMAWCAPIDSREIIEKAVKESDIEIDGWYEIMV